ncbi:MAG TPA: HAD family hydrolase [Fimbriimonadaceae bacterium]|jgi:putative hydrolase of the HAD superfamily
MNEGIVFDLDDTLYFERDYVASGFAAVGFELESRFGVSVLELQSFLWQNFLKGVRGNAFDLLLQSYPLIAIEPLEMVEIYRSHRPTIALSDQNSQLLAVLKGGYRLGIITDGLLITQSNKVEALGLKEMIDEVIYTDSLGPGHSKPSPLAFETIEKMWGLSGRRLTYVADNPAKDFASPKRLGWNTVRLRCEGQLHYEIEPKDSDHSPEREITILTQLLS